VYIDAAGASADEARAAVAEIETGVRELLDERS